MISSLLIASHAAPAHGGGAAEVLDAANWLPGVTALIVFLIAFGVLATQVWPKIVRGLDERENKIRGEIEAAEQARDQANAALAQYQAELAKAREEANRMIAQARSEAKATAEELRSRNEAELADLRARAQRDIRTAKEGAIRQLHEEAATLATAIASRILQRKITTEDQQGLVDDAIKQLATMKN